MSEDLDTKKILFFFNQGRAKRINSTEDIPSEFFYFYKQFQNEHYEVDFIEMDPMQKQTFINKLLKFIDKLMRKLTNLPFYSHQIFNSKNLKKIKGSDILMFTNETLGYSTMLFFLFFYRKKRKIIFTMGLLDDFNNNQKKFLKRILLIGYIKIFDKFFFLSEIEYNFALNVYSEKKSKFYYLPFAVDNNFWNPTNSLENRKKILFVGNDLKRDYLSIVNIATEMQDYEFIFVTERLDNNEMPKNVTLHKSSWRSNKLTDKQLREIYNQSRLSLIPLRDTLQPSGQSVALQSIAMGVPVMISNTKGFWGNKNFENMRNIFIIETSDSWKEKIIEIYNNLELLNHISINAKNTAYEEFNTEILFEKLKHSIFD